MAKKAFIGVITPTQPPPACFALFVVVDEDDKEVIGPRGGVDVPGSVSVPLTNSDTNATVLEKIRIAVCEEYGDPFIGPVWLDEKLL